MTRAELEKEREELMEEGRQIVAEAEANGDAEGAEMFKALMAVLGIAPFDLDGAVDELERIAK